jgi:hypothetical protein
VVHVKVRCLAVLVGLVHIDGIVSFAREAMLTKSGGARSDAHEEWRRANIEDSYETIPRDPFSSVINK